MYTADWTRFYFYLLLINPTKILCKDFFCCFRHKTIKDKVDLERRQEQQNLEFEEQVGEFK